MSIDRLSTLLTDGGCKDMPTDAQRPMIPWFLFGAGAVFGGFIGAAIGIAIWAPIGVVLGFVLGVGAGVAGCCLARMAGE